MQPPIPLELISNFLSLGILLFLGYRYLQYKKNIDVIKGIDQLKEQNKLTAEDINFIKVNEREYREKVIKIEENVKISNPMFILIAGVIIIMLPSIQEALIHLNVVVVAFIFMQVDRIHKKNLHKYLVELKRELKKEEE